MTWYCSVPVSYTHLDVYKRQGICRVTDNYYTKTIQFQDINYQLAQQEDQTAIFEEDVYKRQRKYYYLKLKENFFDSDSIVLLEDMKDGILYSNFLFSSLFFIIK